MVVVVSLVVGSVVVVDPDVESSGSILPVDDVGLVVDDDPLLVDPDVDPELVEPPDPELTFPVDDVGLVVDDDPLLVDPDVDPELVDPPDPELTFPVEDVGLVVDDDPLPLVVESDVSDVSDELRSSDVEPELVEPPPPPPGSRRLVPLIRITLQEAAAYSASRSRFPHHRHLQH